MLPKKSGYIILAVPAASLALKSFLKPFIMLLAVPAASLAYLKRFIMLYGRQCVFQVTGKNAFSPMNNYNSEALNKM